MKDYLLLLRGGPQFQRVTTTDQPQQVISPDFKAWMETLVKGGHFVGGQRLVGNSGAVLKGRKPQLTDGPYAEGKEVVAGYLLIKANDLEEATALAARCPILEHEDGSAEIREIAS